MTYNGRRGPNVSEYIRDLNHVSPQHRSIDENFNMDEDLALFTNTQFFDFDSGQNTDFQAQPVKPDVDVTTSTTPSEDVSAASVMGDMPNLDFMPGELFSQVTVQRTSVFPSSANHALRCNATRVGCLALLPHVGYHSTCLSPKSGRDNTRE